MCQNRDGRTFLTSSLMRTNDRRRKELLTYHVVYRGRMWPSTRAQRSTSTPRPFSSRWSCDRVIVWACDRVIVWSCDHGIVWSCPLNPQASDRVIVWSCDHVNHVASIICGHIDHIQSLPLRTVRSHLPWLCQGSVLLFELNVPTAHNFFLSYLLFYLFFLISFFHYYRLPRARAPTTASTRRRRALTLPPAPRYVILVF